ncbi:hypothetical protein, partial [Microcoleus sp. B4-D4]|uniref:hypothetical protein n=1 Tax=Microcoleus sp. B4-D4 TaxID=2818667 RepID=UPI002FD728F1
NLKSSIDCLGITLSSETRFLPRFLVLKSHNLKSSIDCLGITLSSETRFLPRFLVPDANFAQKPGFSPSQCVIFLKSTMENPPIHPQPKSRSLITKLYT